MSNNHELRRLITVAFLSMGILLGAPTQAAPTTPTSDFTDNGDGTVTHKTTGLTWKRCAEGQAWSNGTCEGAAPSYMPTSYTWAQASVLTSTYAGKSDWRLPTMAELTSIVEWESSSITMNATIFPSTHDSSGFFWAVTTAAANSTSGWFVRFLGGNSGTYLKSYPGQARLVRGGQLLDASGQYTPTTDFTDNGDGSVTHKRTNLTWKRCAEGQTWSGSGCTGTATSHTWLEASAMTATFAGKSDWHLPTQSELVTIIEWSKYAPAINAAIFPDTPMNYFWSATALSSTSAWYASFNHGGYSPRAKTNTHHVRLVRSGAQPGGTSSTSKPDCLFNWAETGHASLFAPAGATTQTTGIYTYRYYSGTQAYLAVANDRVYYLRPATGSTPLDAGPTSQWYPLAGCQ